VTIVIVIRTTNHTARAGVIHFLIICVIMCHKLSDLAIIDASPTPMQIVMICDVMELHVIIFDFNHLGNTKPRSRIQILVGIFCVVFLAIRQRFHQDDWENNQQENHNNRHDTSPL
jgi:hypothetical protein